MSEHQGLDHDLFIHFLRFGLDHADGFFGSGDNQIQVRIAALVVRRVDDVFPIDQTDTDAGDRIVKRDVRKVKGTRCTRDRDHVRVVFSVGRNNRADDLRLESVIVGKQRTDGAVDQAAGQDFFFTRASFAAEIVSGNASG